MSTIRVAMTQTCNAYAPMPENVEDLPGLAGQLEDIRRANVDHHVGLLEAARERGVEIIGLGELFPAPYFALRRDAFWRDLAEDIVHGPTVASMREAARRLGMVVVAPIYERADDGLFNAAAIIDADGTLVGRHRKVHIPTGTNEQGSFDERFYYEGSNGAPLAGARTCSDHRFFPVFETAVARIGVAICYDRHFEGVMAALAGGGAQLVFSPAVTFGAKSRRMWEKEFEVDAARHRLFIGGSNRCGAEPPWNQRYFGESHFVGPSGRGEDRSDHPELIIADLDLGELEGADPSGWDLSRDRRPEAY